MSLTAKQLAKIGIRLIAIFVAVFGLAELPQTAAIGRAWFAEYGLVMAAIIAMPFVMAAVLWGVSNPLARAMVGATDQETTHPTATFEDLQIVVISIAGLLLVIVTLPHLIGQLIGIYATSEIVSGVAVDRRVFNTNLIVGLVSICLKLLLGLILATTPRFWVSLLQRVRELGLPK